MEVWQKVHIILGARSQTLELIAYPHVFIPRTVHKQIYIEMIPKRLLETLFLTYW